MTTTLSHKICLDCTCKQELYFRKACGIARYTWNWALNQWQEMYRQGMKPTAFDLKKTFNSKKKELCPWVYEVTKYASQQPFIHLGKAFSVFFQKKARYPKFKKKGVRDSFYIGGDQLKLRKREVKIPLLGWVRMRESLRFSGSIHGATISRVADRWFISIHTTIEEMPALCESQAVVGVDLGVKNLATLSTGECFPGICPLKRRLKKLKRLSRNLSKKCKGSQNREKAKVKLAKLHYKISCTRQDVLHKLTTYLTENFKAIVIEDLDVSDMLRNSKLARSIADVGLFEFKRQLTYKAHLRGNTIGVADRWYPSSKTCSACGKQKKNLSLKERTYNCDCGLSIDRDLNAAICLENLLNTVSSTEIDACGQDGSVVLSVGSTATSLAETGTRPCIDLYRS